MDSICLLNSEYDEMKSTIKNILVVFDRGPTLLRASGKLRDSHPSMGHPTRGVHRKSSG